MTTLIATKTNLQEMAAHLLPGTYWEVAGLLPDDLEHEPSGKWWLEVIDPPIVDRNLQHSSYRLYQVNHSRLITFRPDYSPEASIYPDHFRVWEADNFRQITKDQFDCMHSTYYKTS